LIHTFDFFDFGVCLFVVFVVFLSLQENESGKWKEKRWKEKNERKKERQKGFSLEDCIDSLKGNNIHKRKGVVCLF